MSLNKYVYLAMQVLHESEWQSSSKHLHFIQAEGANVLFLVSRLLKNQAVADFALYIQKKIDPCCPTLWHVFDCLGLKKPNAVISTYEKEFPKLVLQSPNFQIVTSVFVAEALASWSFHYHDVEKLNVIVDIGLQRFFQNKPIQIRFNKKKSLCLQSQNWVYFTTHIVLVAAMYGEVEIQNKLLFFSVIEVLKQWILLLVSYANKNLEIWLEILVCLNLLEERQFTKQFKSQTLAMFEMKPTIKTPHAFYHTFVLWGFYLKC